jgi:hypothetical protein
MVTAIEPVASIIASLAAEADAALAGRGLRGEPAQVAAA